jgi:hypothetical protein
MSVAPEPATTTEKNIQWSNDEGIGLCTIAYAYKPSSPCGYVLKLLPLLLLIVQVTSPFIIFVPQLEKYRENTALIRAERHETAMFEASLLVNSSNTTTDDLVIEYYDSLCPGGAAFNQKLTMLLITFIYFVRISMNASYLAVNVGKENNVEDESSIAWVGLFDLLGMQVIYENLVYLLNLWLVFQTESPLDMILNAVALEFVTTLDTEFKGRFFDMFPAINGQLTELNNQKTARGKGYACYILSFGCLASCTMLLMFPALIFMMAWGPICKPVGFI